LAREDGKRWKVNLQVSGGLAGSDPAAIGKHHIYDF
jgi:hypothetical protein